QLGRLAGALDAFEGDEPPRAHEESRDGLTATLGENALLGSALLGPPPLGGSPRASRPSVFRGAGGRCRGGPHGTSPQPDGRRALLGSLLAAVGADVVLDHLARHVVGELLGRGLLEVRGRGDQGTLEAVIEGQL